MTQDSNLNDGPVWRALIVTSAPMTLGILGVLLIGLADAFFLARAGDTALAAISFIFPVTTAITSLSIGLSAGTSAVVSQAIGRGADDASRYRITLHAMLLALVLSTLVSLLFYSIAHFIFHAMGARGATLQAALTYVPLWCMAFPFLVTGMALNAVFRAAGRTGIVATMMMSEAVLNIALNPLFIFGWWFIPGLDVAGAGIATLIARAAAMIGLLIFAMRIGAVRFDCQPGKNLLRSVRRISGVGAPAAFSNAINPAGMAIITAAVALVGEAAVAGFGAAGRVQTLLLVPMLALSSGIGPVVGQAWGSGNTERARAAVRLAFLWCLGLGVTVATLATVLADPIARLMTAGGGGQQQAATYLRVASWGFFAYGIVVIGNAAMNARDKALYSMSVSLLRVFVVLVPLVWLGVWLAGFGGILVAMVAGNVIAALAMLIACRAVGLGVVDWPVIRHVADWLERRGLAATN